MRGLAGLAHLLGDSELNLAARAFDTSPAAVTTDEATEDDAGTG